MHASEHVVGLAVLLVYGTYLVLALLAIRVVWRRSNGLSGWRRSAVRSLFLALLFTPAMAGARVAPFLLAVLSSVALDLMFVRPLTLTWAAKSLDLFAHYMLAPFLISWVALLIGFEVVRRAATKK